MYGEELSLAQKVSGAGMFENSFSYRAAAPDNLADLPKKILIILQNFLKQKNILSRPLTDIHLISPVYSFSLVSNLAPVISGGLASWNTRHFCCWLNDYLFSPVTGEEGRKSEEKMLTQQEGFRTLSKWQQKCLKRSLFACLNCSSGGRFVFLMALKTLLSFFPFFRYNLSSSFSFFHPFLMPSFRIQP